MIFNVDCLRPVANQFDGRILKLKQIPRFFFLLFSLLFRSKNLTRQYSCNISLEKKKEKNARRVNSKISSQINNGNCSIVEDFEEIDEYL